jgi:mono/diheme cytochrome c family protein
MRSLLLASALLLVGCEKKAETPVAAGPNADRGKQAYMTHCIACHSADPSKDGTLGPAVKGSSKELITARVLKGEYPPGYKPKRDSKLMVALPHVEKSIDDLYEYLK